MLLVNPCDHLMKNIRYFNPGSNSYNWNWRVSENKQHSGRMVRYYVSAIDGSPVIHDRDISDVFLSHIRSSHTHRER